MSKKVIVRANENFEDKTLNVTRTGGTQFVMSEEDAKKAGKSVTVVGPFGEAPETKEKKSTAADTEKNKAAGPNDSKSK